MPKLLALFALVLFSAIAIAAMVKSGKAPHEIAAYQRIEEPIEIALDQTLTSAVPVKSDTTLKAPALNRSSSSVTTQLPEHNYIEKLFTKTDQRLPIVETIVYKSRVPWIKGRPAWLSDYASYYATSRHFIARSLNGEPNYLKQDLAEGDRFNVFKKDSQVEFHLVIDTSRCKMWFYYVDLAANERVLLKTYRVGLGRVDGTKTSGLLTPLGKYSLGNKIAIYKPKMMGTHHGHSVEMIRVFGTRWIPFEKELGDNTTAARGFGIHGTPWIEGPRGQLVDNPESIGKYESDGCIRLSTEDMEELFAIIITKPTTVELVKDFFDAQLPGNEQVY